jgi:D-threo-aldose 1-dehydrogenase
MNLRQLGTTGLQVAPLCIGTSPLANMAPLSRYDVPHERAIATVRRALEGPINFLDTSNNYGAGSCERVVGEAVTRSGGLPPGFVLATKVDPLPGSSDFSGARVRASIAESLDRLGATALDLVYLHDPERISFEEAMSSDGPVRALLELRDAGVIGHLGVAGAPHELLGRFLRTGHFEVILNHNRYTLIDQSAGELIDEAGAAGVAFVNAAPYGGGLLAKGPELHRKYAYRPAGDDLIRRVIAMRSTGDRHGIPLAALALQFSLRDPRVTSTVVGMSAPERIDETIRLATWPVPQDLWAQLYRL